MGPLGDVIVAADFAGPPPAPNRLLVAPPQPGNASGGLGGLISNGNRGEHNIDVSNGTY